MAQSGSNPTEALAESAEDSFAFSDDTATTLQRLLPDLVFVEEAEVLDRFRCRCCRQIALRTRVTKCHHLLCRPCFENVLGKNCPVAGCTNRKVDDEGKNKSEAPIGLRELKVRCLHHEYGCEEIISLKNLLDHKAICKFRVENLLPILWQPNVVKDNVYIEQLQKDLNVLRKVVKDMKEEMNLIKEELLQKKEELSQIRHNEKGFTSDITLLREQLVKMKNLQEVDIKTLIDEAVVEQWNLQRDALMKDALDYLKTRVDQQRMDLITELSGGLTRQLVKDEARLESNLYDKVKSDNVETLTKYIKELEAKTQVQWEEISTGVKRACSEEFQKKTDELCKEVKDKLETIVEEANLKLEECLRAIDHFKKETEDSLNPKMESKDVKWIIGESCLGSSLSPGWVEWALEERRTEFVWKVSRVRSLLQRWKKEGKGHLRSEVFVTKEFGFKIRAKLEYKFRKWINFSIEFVKEEEEEATPTRPSVYLYRGTFVLMDLCKGSGPKRDIVRIMEPYFGNVEAQRRMKAFWGSEIVLMERLEGGAPYVVKDALCLRILIEPLSVLWKSFASNDGTLLWTIDDYSKKKKDSLEGVTRFLYSDYFYSSPRGFRMRIKFEIYSERDLGMWIVFLRGEWDADLSEGFPHKTTLTILDRSDSKQKKHLIRTEESDSTGGDWMGWIRRPELESGPYLKDDRLMVKVVVEPTG